MIHMLYLYAIYFFATCVVCSVCNFFFLNVTSSDGSNLKGVDESNALVLPANKSKKKTSSLTHASTKKPLTKKQKKELQTVLERKEKKAQVNDNSLLKITFK